MALAVLLTITGILAGALWLRLALTTAREFEEAWRRVCSSRESDATP